MLKPKVVREISCGLGSLRNLFCFLNSPLVTHIMLHTTHSTINVHNYVVHPNPNYVPTYAHAPMTLCSLIAIFYIHSTHQ